jgi:plastocyanin
MDKTQTLILAFLTLVILVFMAISGCSDNPATTPGTPGVLTTIPPIPPDQTAVEPTSTPSGPVTNASASPTPTNPGVNPPPATATPPGTVATSNTQVSVDLTAQDMAFDKSVITVPAGAQVTINFINKDKVGHNFAAYTSEAATTPIFVGEIISSSSITYKFTAPSTPGTYFFRCDPHARIMKGQLIVQ